MTCKNPFSTASFSPQQNRGSFVCKDFQSSLFTWQECHVQKNAELVLPTFTYSVGQPLQGSKPFLHYFLTNTLSKGCFSLLLVDSPWCCGNVKTSQLSIPLLHYSLPNGKAQVMKSHADHLRHKFFQLYRRTTNELVRQECANYQRQENTEAAHFCSPG